MGASKPQAETTEKEKAPAPEIKAPKTDFTKEKIPINYLAKVVSNKEAFLRKKEAYVQKLRTFYKFNEGFSNAVRKPVKMSAFF